MVYRTPGVFVEEIRVFPPSVAEVASAVPIFIGYTEKAKFLVDNDLVMKPKAIRSYPEFVQYFGEPESQAIAVTVTKNADNVITGVVFTTQPEEYHDLGTSLKMYFDNGGGKCFVVSVGALGTAYTRPAANTVRTDLVNGLNVAEAEDEPTLIVVPEASLQLLRTDAATGAADYTEYGAVVQAMLGQCEKLKDRFAILDAVGDPENNYARAQFVGDLSYGAAYYPFLRTNYALWIAADESNVSVKIGTAGPALLSDVKTTDSDVYNAVKAEITRRRIVVPPSPVLAGIIAKTDERRGVAKSPANVGVINVIEPTIKLNDSEQEELNYEVDGGRSINVIRSFSGKTVVWGARTLAGNDNEWRYISVRRFFSVVEESVKKSTVPFVFEPNTSDTWTKVRGMIEAYLTQKWRENQLAGATPKDAFYVRCGLGSTMTPDDVLNGYLNVEIGMAVVRPCEFIVLKFSHKLQTS